MQLFAKKFTTSSSIGKHKEDPEVYGDWVWDAVSPTDETDGELCTEDMRILPKRNRLVIMRTGFDPLGRTVVAKDLIKWLAFRYKNK